MALEARTSQRLDVRRAKVTLVGVLQSAIGQDRVTRGEGVSSYSMGCNILGPPEF